MSHRGCVRIIFMGCATDGGLYLVTILMGDRESLVGVGLIMSIPRQLVSPYISTLLLLNK